MLVTLHLPQMIAVEMMPAGLFLVGIAFLNIAYAHPQSSAVQITVLGTEGSRIDLTENYHPLSSAVATNSRDVKVARSPYRAFAPRPAIVSKPSLSLEKAEQIQAELESAYVAGWQPWSDWSECFMGEKIRYRSCIPTPNVSCVGMKIEKQPCSATDAVEIPFAKDPWAIEREINFQGFRRPSEP